MPEKSKLVKFKNFKDSHPRNINPIDSTLFVLKLDKSKFFNFSHSKNIPLMLVTFSVSKLDKSTDVKDLK